MIEVYDLPVDEAIAVWQDVRGEGATWGEYREFQNRSLKWFMESSLREAISRKIGVGWHERSDGRTGYRNGYYERLLVTPFGTVTIQVPRLREGSYTHDLFERQKLFTDEVGELVMETYLAGISVRRVGEVLKKVLGYEVSAGTVSDICKGLDKLVREYWRRVLDDKWRYLLLDAVVLKSKSAIGVEKRFILTALGIDEVGNREIISFKQVESESEVAWESLLTDMYQRGFKGKKLELITTDGNPGVIAAIESIMSNVPRQRCWVHKLRNISNKLKKRNEKECLAGARLIYLAKNRTDAIARYREWAVRWKGEEPRAVACMTEDIEELLNVFYMPEEHRIKIRTTNPIERVFREVRRRTRTISCFTNRRSVDRMVYAILARQNKIWKEERPLWEITQSA